MTQGKMMDTVVRLMGQIDPSLKKSLEATQKQFKKMNKTALAVNGAFVAMGAVAIKTLSKGVDQAAKFEKQMSNVSTLLDGDVKKRIGELNKEVIKVSNHTGVVTSDLTDGLYQVVSAIGDTADSMKIVELAAKSAKAGNATTTDSVNLLTAVTKGYGDTSKEAFQKASDLAFQTVKLGQTTFPDLAASMGSVIPLANALHIKQEELFGGFATLTGVTGNAAEVSTQLNGAFKGFMTPSKEMLEVMSKLGYASGEQMLKAHGLEKSLLILKQAVGNNDTAFASLFKSIQGKKAVLALTGAQVDNMRKKTEKMYHVTGLTDEAFKRQRDNYETLKEDIENLNKNALTQLGMIFLPVIKRGMELILPVFELLSEHSEGLTTIMAGLFTVLGSYAVIYPLIQAYKLLQARTLMQTIENWSLVNSLRAVAAAFFSTPAGWLALALGAVVTVVILLTRHWDTITEVIKKFGSTVFSVLSQVWSTVAGVFGKVSSFIKDTFVNVLLASLDAIGLIIKGIMKISSGVLNIGKGKNKGANIPQLAAGGFTNGLSFAGEAGREAVISFDPAYRSNNISTWLKAGEMLGVSGGSSMSSVSLGGITMNVSFVVKDSESADSILRKLKNAEGELGDMILDVLENRSLGSYGARGSSY